MSERNIRTEMLIGNTALDRICKSHVAVFGIGGVGGYIVEALARSGVGRIALFEHNTPLILKGLYNNC